MRVDSTTDVCVRSTPSSRPMRSISGAYDMIAVVQAGSIDRLDALIDRIGLLDGVERTHTSVVLSTRIQR